MGWRFGCGRHEAHLLLELFDVLLAAVHLVAELLVLLVLLDGRSDETAKDGGAVVGGEGSVVVGLGGAHCGILLMYYGKGH